tara:strand:+ start:1140 stop:1925 length:786 start_codon:yes stop_codon:yes gene_type:complete
MFNSKKIDWVIKNPYNIFKVSDFLKEEEFLRIEKNFPDYKNLNKNSLFKFKDNKFAITSGSQEYKEIILSNEVLRKFHEFVNGEDFKKVFFSNLFSNILFARGFNLKHIIKMLKIPRFVNKIDKNFFKKNLTIFSNFRITIQYSYILNEGLIVPHPDAGDKILSLLLFFPQYKSDHKNSMKEKNYGTTFWKSNFKDEMERHISESAEQKSFKEKSNILYKSDFLKNHLVGFIKNKHSWHSVEPVNVHEEYVRKSININIYY